MSGDMPEATEADLAYLRNINTRAGPDIGQSIDRTLPGPSADRIKPEHLSIDSLTDLLSKCVPYLQPYGDPDAQRLLREIEAAMGMR